MAKAARIAPPEAAPTRVKMSVLARMSGVPAATIKHYLLAGLLPQPERTSRNMAYYDVSLVPRIERIKELQRTRFLPLDVIREVLDGSEDPDETVAASIARVLAPRGTDRRTRTELERSGLPRAQLDWLIGTGLVRGRKDGKHEVFEGDDLELLRLLGAARKAGLDPAMLPLEVLGEYAQALGALVRAELSLFRAGVLPRAGAKLPELTEAATELSEKLVLLLRRKMLLPTLEALVREAEAPGKPRRRK